MIGLRTSVNHSTSSVRRKAMEPELPEHAVDRHLASIRLRTVGEVLQLRLPQVCPGLSPARVARLGGIFLRLVLNIVVILQSVWSPSALAGGGGLRALAAAELVYFFVQVSVLAKKGRRLCWQSAAEACDALRPLANWSMLNHIPRVRHVVPEAWKIVQAERSRLQRLEAQPAVERRSAIGVAGLRLWAVVATELGACLLGLISLQQKLLRLQDASRRSMHVAGASFVTRRALPWLRFVGFANQVTGVVDREALYKQATLNTAFASSEQGEDLHCREAMLKFKGLLLRELCALHGWCKGSVLYVSLLGKDYQQLLVARDRLSQAPQERSEPREPQATAVAWLESVGPETVLGQLRALVDGLLV